MRNYNSKLAPHPDMGYKFVILHGSGTHKLRNTIKSYLGSLKPVGFQEEQVQNYSVRHFHDKRNSKIIIITIIPLEISSQ